MPAYNGPWTTAAQLYSRAVSASISIVWFRNDLRLADNPALNAAAQRGGPVIPVFIWAPDEDEPWSPGAASQWWLHQSLARLDAAVRTHGARLIIRNGPTLAALRALIQETGATAIFWNCRYEPAIAARDAAIAAALLSDGCAAHSGNGTLLFEPGAVSTHAGKPFQVFTPFWNACRAAPQPVAPLSAPAGLPAPLRWPATATVSQLTLEPSIDWAAGMRAAWQPGEGGAHEQLARFLDGAVARYPAARDRPDMIGTSRLSPHLHFGEISARQVWHAVHARCAIDVTPGLLQGGDAYLRQLGWREFAHHLLFHFPWTTDAPLRPAFSQFPWSDDAVSLRAWQRGCTGYPIVDAGMRELWDTGWMHNRVRMLVASFLVKDLLLPWQAGARWFWDTLVDADLANNTLGWQWTAGCGADAAPFFRVDEGLPRRDVLGLAGQVFVRRKEEATLAAQIASVGDVVDRAADVEVADLLVAGVPGVVEQGADGDHRAVPCGRA